MMKSIVPAAVLSLLVVSTAWALPVPSTSKLQELSATELVLVGKKHHGGKHYKYKGKYHGKYGKRYRGPWRGHYHGGRYWKHRYVVRPYNWGPLGCINVGAFWYCP